VAIVSFPLSSIAEDHGGGGGDHGGGSEKEGGDHGGGGGFIKKDEYLEVKSAIEQFNAKIKIKKDELKKLILEKEVTKNPVVFQETEKKIEKVYKEISELYENIDKKQTILRYRFPERTFVKTSEKEKVQKIEEIGAEALIEREVDNLLILVESQYKKNIRPESERVKMERGPASEKDHQKDGEILQNPEDFSRSLILKK
jgi:hypothetical protein